MIEKTPGNIYNSDIFNYYFTIPNTENINRTIEEEIDTFLSVLN